MLNYVITVAISAFFVPHYLSIFWEPLRTNPWDIIVGIVVVVLLVGINIVGIKEAAALNVLLAVVDFATQLLLVLLGFVLDLQPAHRCTANVHWGVAPTWANFALAIPVAMIAYTGIETVSNLAEEARDPRRSDPGVDPARRDRRLRDLLHAAARRALGAAGLPGRATGDYVTQLGLDPPERLQERPGARARREPRPARARPRRARRSTSASSRRRSSSSPTNAGVIGASRITYSMSSYRQLPEVFRRLHPRFKTPWLVADRLRRRSSRSCSCSRATSTSSAACTRSGRCSRSRSRTPR